MNKLKRIKRKLGRAKTKIKTKNAALTDNDLLFVVEKNKLNVGKTKEELQKLFRHY